MNTVRLTTAQAIVKYLIAQRTVIDGSEEPLFAGAFGIFGHGNVVSLAEALQPVQDELPTWRGHNEQSMALAAVAFAKAKRRRQIMIATSSVGPGSTNMVTAAATAHANRLAVADLQRRYLPASPGRPGPPASRALRQPVDHRQRRLPGGHPLLGSHHPARADHPDPPPSRRHHARPGRLRPGVYRTSPGHRCRGV